jgi:rubrerythrin
MGEISPDMMEAIKMAIQIEKDGKKYYEEAASKTNNELGKKMFESLAKDEMVHLETFQKMFDTIAGKEEWRELAEGSPKVGKVPIFDEEVSEKSKPDTNDIDALRVALDNERDSIELYKKASEEIKDSLARKIFTKIREEEEYHYDLLQAQKDHLTKSGFWFDVGEFQMDGKY